MEGFKKLAIEKGLKKTFPKEILMMKRTRTIRCILYTWLHWAVQLSGSFPSFFTKFEEKTDTE